MDVHFLALSSGSSLSRDALGQSKNMWVMVSVTSHSLHFSGMAPKWSLAAFSPVHKTRCAVFHITSFHLGDLRFLDTAPHFDPVCHWGLTDPLYLSFRDSVRDSGKISLPHSLNEWCLGA